jgi:hypothetical protein
MVPPSILWLDLPRLTGRGWTAGSSGASGMTASPERWGSFIANALRLAIVPRAPSEARTSAAPTSALARQRPSRDRLPAWLVMAIFVVWCAAGRVADLVRWCAAMARLGLARGAVALGRASRRAQARLSIVGRHARQVLCAMLRGANEQVVVVGRSLVPLARTAWRWLLLAVVALLGALWRAARSSARATRSLLVGAVTPRRVVVVATAVASLWALSAPGLRLGAEVFAREVDIHGSLHSTSPLQSSGATARC